MRNTVSRLALVATTLALGSVFAVAEAAETQPFTQKAFAAAQAAGRPILVEITAPWCPTCKAQHPILGALTGQPKFKDLAIFDVDFDHQKDVVRALHATMQSTLVVYHGASEVARSVGDTDKASIASQLDKAV